MGRALFSQSQRLIKRTAAANWLGLWEYFGQSTPSYAWRKSGEKDRGEEGPDVKKGGQREGKEERKKEARKG